MDGELVLMCRLFILHWTNRCKSAILKVQVEKIHVNLIIMQVLQQNSRLNKKQSDMPVLCEMPDTCIYE